jgi:hypothetical protein
MLEDFVSDFMLYNDKVINFMNNNSILQIREIRYK